MNSPSSPPPPRVLVFDHLCFLCIVIIHHFVCLCVVFGMWHQQLLYLHRVCPCSLVSLSLPRCSSALLFVLVLVVVD